MRMEWAYLRRAKTCDCSAIHTVNISHYLLQGILLLLTTGHSFRANIRNLIKIWGSAQGTMEFSTDRGSIDAVPQKGWRI